EHRCALDLGCGSGHNTRLLLEHAFQVTAIAISEQALELCRRGALNARVEWADIREGLPFAGDHFEFILADLSLHYFPLDMTAAIVKDIANRLVPGGLFAGRFNSTGDAKYGTGEPVRGEPDLLIVNGIEKRFFTRECFSKLFGPPWTMAALAEKTVCRLGFRKVIWELVALTSFTD
ncbi:MAG: class I SAM-dependent methyltransferase, partial [Deltaproteobacteria bacterium]